MAHPSGCKAIASAKLKYDKLDARTLANLLRTGYLAEAWLAPPEVREQRLLLRERAWLVRLRTMAKNRIRAQLAEEGIRPPVSLWTQTGHEWLEDLELSELHRRVVGDCEVLLAILESRIIGLEATIRADARHDPWVEAMRTIPGIGLLTAMTLTAEIGDIARFPTARKLCAWAGLTPSMRNSDRKAHHGHITKDGPAAVRHVLGEAGFDRAVEVAHGGEVLTPGHDLVGTHRRRGHPDRLEAFSVGAHQPFRSLQVHEMAEAGLAEGKKTQLDPRRVPPCLVGEVWSAHVRRGADGRQQVLDHRPVQHLVC